MLPVELGLWEGLLDSWVEKNGKVKIHSSETIFALFTRQQGSQVGCPLEVLKALIAFTTYWRGRVPVLSAHQVSGCLCLGGYSSNRPISRQPHSLLLLLPLVTGLVSNKLTSSLILQILFYCLSPLNLTVLCCLIIHSACLTWPITMNGWLLQVSVFCHLNFVFLQLEAYPNIFIWTIFISSSAGFIVFLV